MLNGAVSYVKAVKDFFESAPFGRKVEMDEFKALTYQDKLDLREMLIGEGYDVDEVKAPAAS